LVYLHFMGKLGKTQWDTIHWEYDKIILYEMFLFYFIGCCKMFKNLSKCDIFTEKWGKMPATKCYKISQNVTKFTFSVNFSQNKSYIFQRNLTFFVRNLSFLPKKAQKTGNLGHFSHFLAENQWKLAKSRRSSDLRQTFIGSSDFSRAYIQYFYLRTWTRSRVFYYWGLGNIRWHKRTKWAYNNIFIYVRRHSRDFYYWGLGIY